MNADRAEIDGLQPLDHHRHYVRWALGSSRNGAPKLMTPSQCRAGRALLGLQSEKLAKSAGLRASTVEDFEAGERSISNDAVERMRVALEGAGVAFVPSDSNGGEGVRLRSGPRFQEGTRPQDLNTGNDD